MKVPISWLKEFVDIPAGITAEALAERLTVAGLEVTKLHYIGVPQGDDLYGVPPSDHLVWARDKILLGYIREIKAHPDADRLVLAMVDYGAGELEQVVTGAPNLFDYVGQGQLDPPLLAPFALEGAEVIDGHSDGQQRMILEERELRGIPNRCMVCSEMELGISDEHEGIMLLDAESFGQHAPGTPLQDVLGDVVIEFELTPNYARCFSVLGVACEVAALYNTPLREPDYTLPETSGDPVEEAVRLEIHEPDLNPRFTLGLLRDVTIQPSPGWMQWRLKLVGQRPINNIVDVTNYVMFEMGQPTHAFDYDALQARAGDDTPLIYTRLAEKGEKLTTLDGKTHQLTPEHLLVCDGAGILSFGGVMGGEETEVQAPDEGQGRAGSRTVLLEAAGWNLIAIRKTVQSTKLTTEASARFSRGVHPAQALLGQKRGLKLMAEVSGAELAPGILDVYPDPPEPVVIELPMSEITRLLGFDIDRENVVDILERLGMTITDEATDPLEVTVPDSRLDISPGATGQADLVEEIARIYGYDQIPDTTIADALPPQYGNPDLDREEAVRDLLVEAGLQEVINYRFTTPAFERKLVPDGASWDWPQAEYVEILNPSTVERTALRQTLLSSLLENAKTNQRHTPSQQLFEIGPVFYGRDGDLPDEKRHLGLLMTGPRTAQGWMNSTEASQPVDYYDLKGVVEALLDGLHIAARRVRYVPVEHSSFHPGRVARLEIDEQAIGLLGEVHPLVREAFGLGLDLETPVVAAEFDLDTLLTLVPWRMVIEALPSQPPVYRDIAVVVPEETTAAEIEAVIWDSGGPHLHSVRLFDVYRGENIAVGHKSLAYALTFRSDEETLNDRQVNKQQKKIIKALEAAGAKLRA